MKEQLKQENRFLKEQLLLKEEMIEDLVKELNKGENKLYLNWDEMSELFYSTYLDDMEFKPEKLGYEFIETIKLYKWKE